MARRLLVVHPEHKYDKILEARDAIAGLLKEFNSGDVFVLFDDPDKTSEYLKSSAGLWLSSKSGEISEPDAKKIMDGCAELTVVGNNFNDCHYDAFEAVSKQIISDTNIVLPTYASTEGIFCRLESDEIQRICQAFERHRDRLEITYKFGQPYPCLSTKEKVTLKEAQRYVAALTRREHSVDVYVDGRKVFDRQKGENKVALLIRNKPPVDFRYG